MRLQLSALLPLLTILLHPPAPLNARPSTAPLCFPGVPGVVDCLDEVFRAYWQDNGGLPVFGYPIGPALPEETSSGLRTVQHFQRSRLELHPEAPEPYRVQLGLLGVERLAQLGRTADPAVQPAPGCQFFAPTGHHICGAFLAYWQAHGLNLGDRGISERESLALLGLPLTEPTWEVNGSGDRVLTQWFERARLEDHHGKSTQAVVLQGLLGAETESGRSPAAPPAGWITVAGNRLVQQGQPITLKGINYYPAAHPWSAMWTQWNSAAVAQDLLRARRDLGINTVRVLVPYRKSNGWMDDDGNVEPHMLDRLHQFVQVAGELQLKVIVTLFDWHDGTAEAGSSAEARDLKYLRTIVGAFKDDDRVLAWDLHNEPDHYPAWGAGQAAAVVDWLGRMADATRALDRRHPLTVGVGKHTSLWQAAPNGRTIADISDVLSIHGYDAAIFASMLREVRARSSKPVLLEEFGWPSGPACRGPYYDEGTQRYLYQQAMQLAATNELSGLMGWWFQDPPATLANTEDENGYYGLYRYDGTPKPAVGAFRTLRVPPLASTATSAFPLTVVAVPLASPLYRPLVFEDGLVLRDQFKFFWDYFGGEVVFGRPLTLATRDQHGKLVQYFQRARFELDDSGNSKGIFPDWPEGQTDAIYLARVHLAPLGQQAIAGQTIARVPDPAQPEIRYFPETGHTLSGDFRAFWETHGAPFFGLPLTEAFDEVIDGQRTRVQYFTNWRFEQEGNGPVRLASLGVNALQARQCPRP